MKTINLDRRLNIKSFWDIVGFDRKEFISIVGRTGSGKTALSIILACLAYLKYGKKILFIGNEGYREQFDKYLLRYQNSSLSMKREEEDWVTIQVVNNDITFEEIKEYSRSYNPDVIVIDSYVAYKGFDDIMDFSTKLKSFVGTENKTVIVTTQLNRIDDGKVLEGNYLSYVSDMVLFCSLQDKTIRVEMLKSRQGKQNTFESEY